MNTATFPKIAEALRAIAALLDEACESAAKAAAAQPALPVAAAPAASTEVSTAEESSAVAEAPAAATADDVSPVEQAAEPPAVQPITPTYDNAKAAVINLGKTLGREAITELLAGFDAKRLPDVPESQWAAVIAAANARLERHFFEDQQSVGANNHSPAPVADAAGAKDFSPLQGNGNEQEGAK